MFFKSNLQLDKMVQREIDIIKQEEEMEEPADVVEVVSVNTPERSTSLTSDPETQMTDLPDETPPSSQQFNREEEYTTAYIERLVSLPATTPRPGIMSRNSSLKEKRPPSPNNRLLKRSKSNEGTDDEEDEMSSGGRKNITRRKNKMRIKSKKTIIKRNVKKLNKTKNKRKKINRNRTIRKRK